MGLLEPGRKDEDRKQRWVENRVVHGMVQWASQPALLENKALCDRQNRVPLQIV